MDGPVAHIKYEPDAWRVYESLNLDFTAEGEHVYFYVEKEDLNTADVVRELAQACGVAQHQVGYAGLKDKHAVTRQWFSVVYPDNEWPLTRSDIRCLEVQRHIRKLRRGQHVNNQFELRLRVEDDMALNAIAHLDDWFPNYFGPQRVSPGNIAQARAWLEQGGWGAGPRSSARRNRGGRRRRQGGAGGRRGWHLSVLRSELFNTVLQYRVDQQNYATPIDGDVLDEGVPTGPLWGRGRSPVLLQAEVAEKAALAPHAGVCEALEYAGVDQGRRRLAERPQNFVYEIASSNSTCEVLVRFQLPPGAFATTLLAHKLTVMDDSDKHE